MSEQTTATLEELVAKRGQTLARMTDIIETSKTANDGKVLLSDAERADYDTAKSEFDTLTDQITEATAAAGDASRGEFLEHARSVGIPRVIVAGPPPSANRSLDEILWASAPVGVAENGARVPIAPITYRSHKGEGEFVAPRIGDFRPEHLGAVRGFQDLVADMALFGLMIDTKATTSGDGFQVARSHRLFKDRWGHAMRALDTDTSAEGTEWIPTGIGATLHEKVRVSGKIAPLFARINLPTNPWKWPLEGADATAYRVAEPTSDTATKATASTPGTAAATFDAEILGGRILFSRSLEADSALAILPFVQNKLVQAFVDAEEKAILDGDSDGTHQDTDVQAIGATDARTAWDGLRKRALAQTVLTGQTTSTAANLALIRGAMGKWGVNPANLAFIVGLSAYIDLLADSNVLTVDKFGPSATILTGQLASVHGVPIIVSEHVREDLNATGVNDGITQTKTYNMCVHRGEWAMGQRTALDIAVDDSIYRESYQRVAVAFMREDFQAVSAVATDDTTALAYNITP